MVGDKAGPENLQNQLQCYLHKPLRHWIIVSLGEKKQQNPSYTSVDSQWRLKEKETFRKGETHRKEKSHTPHRSESSCNTL